MAVIARFLHYPITLYQRRQSVLEHAVTVVCFTALLWGLLSAIPVYPANWVPVMLLVVAVTGFFWPTVAYFIALFCALYPVYTVSLYLAVLFLAVALLGQRIFIHNLGPVVLVLSIPYLTQYRLEWLAPLLGGLWWGVAGGAWIGALAALWGKLLGGMTGLDIDWLMLSGTRLPMDGVVRRFEHANSLQTLQRLLEPFAPDSTVLLYHLLQVLSWAVAGAVVGALIERRWIKQRAPWSTVGVLSLGGVVLLSGYFMLPLWLNQRSGEDMMILAPSFVLMGIVTVGVSAVGGLVRNFGDAPVRPPKPRRAKRARTGSTKTGRKSAPAVKREAAREKSGGERGKSTSGAGPRRHRIMEPEELAEGPAPLPVPDLPAWELEDEDDDLIMIELD